MSKSYIEISLAFFTIVHIIIFRTSPEKTSRDSGVITPSEGGSLTSPDHSEAGSKQVNPEDFTTMSRSEEKQLQQPVKAALVTVELDNNRYLFPNNLKP